MQLTFYAFNKRVNSTKQVDTVGTVIECTLKEGTSIHNPSFLVNNFNLEWNYCKWDNRYYFITDVVLVRYGLYEAICAEDVLASNKAEIANINAFVRYSESRNNPQIIDSRLSVNSTAEYNVTTATIISDPSERGTYIINYVTDNATYGATGLLWTNDTGVQLLSQQLTNTEFFNLENFEKQFGNVYQSLLGCKYVPFDWWGRFFPAGIRNFRLGSFETTVAGAPVRNKVEYSRTISIPWQFNDFRNLSPYTSFIMFLPGYGLIEIDPSDILGKTALSIKLTIDGVTGEGTYIIDRFFKGTCNFAVSVPIGTVSSNIGGFFGGTLQAATSLVGGDSMQAKLGGGIAGLATAAIATKQRTLGNIGSLGSSASIFASIGANWNNAYMVAITHNTTVDPRSIAPAMGRPLQEVSKLGELTGYVQTVGASVAADNSDIAAQINDLLDGGVFIE